MPPVNHPTRKTIASPSSSKGSRNPLKVLGTMNLEDIKKELDRRDIQYMDNDTKSYLSALFSLQELDICNKKMKTATDALIDDAMLGAAERWCSATIKDLMSEVRARELSRDGIKWDHVMHLILDEYQRLEEIVEDANTKLKKARSKRKGDPDADDDSHGESGEERKMTKAKVAKKIKSNQKEDLPKAKKTTTETKQTEKSKADGKINGVGLTNIDLDGDQIAKPEGQTSPEVMSFLLYMIYTHLESGGSVDVFPNCPVTVGPQLKRVIKNIPVIKNDKDVSKLSENEQEIIDWVGKTFGHLLALPNDSITIPGLDKSITQFIINLPTKDRHYQFVKHLAAKGDKSTVLFHGTPTSNLLSILLNGFRPSVHDNGVWTALAPEISLAYAFKQKSSTYTKSSHCSCGVILGLDVAGEGPQLGVTYPGIHVIQQLKSIMARYVFVLPPSLMTTAILPKRGVIEPAMKEAFKKIEEGISGGLN